MLIKEFPDLKWLKAQTEQRFRSRLGPNGVQLPGSGWPTVLLNVKTGFTERPDIRGPLSLFANLSGSSFATANRRRVRVDESTYFLTNPDEYYTLEISSPVPVETFNIHFGHGLAESVWESWTQSADCLLDQAEKRTATLHFFNQLYRKDAHLEKLFNELRSSSQQGNLSGLYVEEQLTRVLLHLLAGHQQLLRRVKQLPPLKAATRTELYQRLSLSVDYLYTFYDQPLTLDQLAATACLSKFHFLRLFKQAFGRTPYQFLLEVRLSRAQDLLKGSALPVQDIALQLGFDSANAFSHAFYKHTRFYPSQYRLCSA